MQKSMSYMAQFVYRAAVLIPGSSSQEKKKKHNTKFGTRGNKERTAGWAQHQKSFAFPGLNQNQGSPEGGSSCWRGFPRPSSCIWQCFYQNCCEWGNGVRCCSPEHFSPPAVWILGAACSWERMSPVTGKSKERLHHQKHLCEAGFWREEYFIDSQTALGGKGA